MPRTFRSQSATNLENKRKNQPSSGRRFPRHPEKTDSEVLWSTVTPCGATKSNKEAIKKNSQARASVMQQGRQEICPLNSIE